jgi:hypothetical protein
MRVPICLLLCAVAGSPLSHAATQRTTLTCELDITTQPAHGEARRSHERAEIELLFDEVSGFKAVTIHSAAVPVAVANKKGGAVTSFLDHSSGERWDISNVRDRTKVASDERVVIEPKTGVISAYSSTTVGDASERVEAHGHCATAASKPQKS